MKLSNKDIEEMCRELGIENEEDIKRMKEICIKPAFGSKQYTFTKPL